MRVPIVKQSSLGDVARALPIVHDVRVARLRAVIDRLVEPGVAPLPWGSGTGCAVAAS